MYIGICDDEKICQDSVDHFLQQFMATKNIRYHTKAFSDGESLLSAYEEKEHFDLIFLDIFMGEQDGMTVAKALRERGFRGEIVFLTTSRDFAVESYRVSALSYLLKPVGREDFCAVMEKFLHLYRPAKLRAGDCIFSVSDLVYAESQNKKILFHFLDGSIQIVQGKFEDMVLQLHFPNFLRCHRCYIVNLDHIRKIENGYFLTVTKECVFIRQKEFQAIKKLYYRYVLSQ